MVGKMNNDWLDNVNPLMREVREKVEELREARFKMDEAESLFTLAKNNYQRVVQDVAQVLRSNGLESLRTTDNSTITVTTCVRCSIKKDEQSQKEIAQWLRYRDMGALVKSELVVMPSNKHMLDEMGIAYDEHLNINTNQVKAYVKSELDVGTLERRDIPKGLSWFEYDDIVIKDGQ